MLYLLLFIFTFSNMVFAASPGNVDLSKVLNSEPEVRLNYEIYGQSDSPTLVLIHGLGADLHVFGSVVDDLATRFQVIVYDQRGHGKSEAKGSNYSLTVIANDLRDLLAQLGIKKAHILGHSFGGRTAMKFAALHPELVQSLIVGDMDTVPRTRKPTLTRADARKAVQVDAKKAQKLSKIFETREELRKALAPLIGHALAEKASNHAYESNSRQIQLPEAYSKYDAFLLYDFEAATADLAPDLAKVADVKIPILFVRGGQSNAMGKRGIGLLTKIPGVKIETIQQADHFVHISGRSDFLNIIIPFLLAAVEP